MRIFENMTEVIGNTPLLRLSRISRLYGCQTAVCAKNESFNPCGSSKDRAAMYMLESGIRSGLINSDTVIVEATSGNTGVALAAVCAVKGLRCILTMPENMSDERKKLLALYGAELVLTKKEKGMTGAVEEAERICRENKNTFIPNQFSNPANPLSHYETTARELWDDTDGTIKNLVAGVGSGGTLSGIARFLKEKDPNIKVYGVQPASSQVLTGGTPMPHGIQGIGANFVPENFDPSLCDGILNVSDGEAVACARELARTEGLLCGISSGAAVLAAIEVAKKDPCGLTVCILPDTGERYLSAF